MQKLKTRVVKKNLNPEWNEELTLSISDPHTPIHLVSNFSLNVVCVSNQNLGLKDMKFSCFGLAICIIMLLLMHITIII